MGDPILAVIYYLSFYGILGALTYRYLRRRKKFSSLLVANIVDIRSTFIADPNNGDILRDEWKKKSDDKPKVISNVADYITIEDSYLEMAKRNAYILNNTCKQDDSILKKFNRSCLILANTDLKNVNWQEEDITSTTR